MAILSDEFYYQPIRIDTINTRIYADIVAKEGDANGRGLLLTLTENGLMKDTTGITLILKWEHTSVVSFINPFSVRVSSNHPHPEVGAYVCWQSRVGQF